MTKAELKKAYTEERDKHSAGEMYTNEYALHLDEMLSEYLGVPGTAISEDDTDLP